MKALIKTGLFFVGSLSAFSSAAYEITHEFSAEAVQTIPGRPATKVNMFVSKNAVRTESKTNGNTISEIVFVKDQRRLLLNSSRKIYVEQNSQNINAARNNKINGSPCENVVNATCKKIGDEKINGRNAVKWEMTARINGQTLKSLYWQDKKYHMPLREQLHDGTVATMTMLGKEKINGRNTEKWIFNAMRPNGQKMESLQWYDPKLKMVIREVLPGGYVRELKNIKIAKQNKRLFNIPSDYKKEGVPAMFNQKFTGKK